MAAPFHGPADDDTQPGTVFETEHDGYTTIWLVIDRRRARYLRYSRVTPSIAAGTVAVELSPDGDGCAIDVTCVVTALSAEGDALLTSADADPSANPSVWREPVARYLDSLAGDHHDNATPPTSPTGSDRHSG